MHRSSVPGDASRSRERLLLLLNSRRWNEAEELARQIVSIDPADAWSHFVAGVALLEQRQSLTAIDFLRKAARLDPARSQYAIYLARALTTVQDLEGALSEADRAVTLSSGDPFALDTLGVVYTSCHAHEQAAAMFRKAVALIPGNADFQFNLAMSLMYHGDIGDAEQALEACIALNPRHWRAHHSLSQLRKQNATDNHVLRLRGLLPLTANSPTAALFVNMALAKELEDLGEYAASFSHLVAGKSAPKELVRYSYERDKKLFEALRGASPVAESADGFKTDEPIFIVGMPRTGTTLIDRIVSAHSDVHPAGELHNFAVAWKRAMGGPNFSMFRPEDISNAGPIDWYALGKGYLQSTRPLTGHTARFTDKLPHNFLYLGYIAHALPRAKIICVRRNPMDTCLSNFRQLFAPESPYFDYSYDLLDTGRYYLLFDRLMAHWHRVLPNRILEVSYEDVVDHLEPNARRIIDFCGLSWQDGCLAFERNSSPVTTASAVQVRAPIYRSALQRWKRYEKELQPLRSLLDAAGVTIRD